MPEFAVTVIGRDRPGIVAAVSRGLDELGGSIEDSQASILRGRFAVLLVVRVPDSVSDDALSDRLGSVRDELGLEAIVFNRIEEPEAAMRPATHTLTVYGANHPGIVHAVSRVLAKLDVNITDLETRFGGAGERPVHAMVMEVAVGDTDLEPVEAELRAVAERERVEIILRPLKPG